MPKVQILGVDPVGSLYYDFVKTGRITKPFSYKVEGIGEDFFPTTMNLKILDDVVRVDDKECFLMTRDMTRLEGLFVGARAAPRSRAIKWAKTKKGPSRSSVPVRCRSEVRLEDLQRRLDARERLPRGRARTRHRQPMSCRCAASTRS